MRSAADRTRKDVRVANLPENQRELVAAFSRRLDDVPEELLERLKDIILKSLATETPFHRKRRGLVVPPLSAAKLRKHAERIRSIILDDVEIEFPIIKVLEHVLPKVFEGFYLDVVDTEVMGDDEGRVLLGTPCLMLREDVYTGACRGVGRHRFTAAHELGHFLLHREVPMARARDTDMPIYRDSEWQADTFAGALFMSSRHLKWFEDSEDAAKKCGMSYAAAEYQWGLYEREGLVPGP